MLPARKAQHSSDKSIVKAEVLPDIWALEFLLPCVFTASLLSASAGWLWTVVRYKNKLVAKASISPFI